MKVVTENVCSGGSDLCLCTDTGGDDRCCDGIDLLRQEGASKEEWKVITTRSTTMKLSEKLLHPEAFSFSVLPDDVEVYEERKAVDVPQSKGKSRSLFVVGNSLCRYLGGEVMHRVKGIFCFPVAGVRKVSESVEGLVDGNSLTFLIAGGNDVQGCRSEELIRLH